MDGCTPLDELLPPVTFRLYKCAKREFVKSCFEAYVDMLHFDK